MKRLIISAVILTSIVQGFSASPNRLGRSATQASLFGKFGGNGSDGSRTVSGNETVGATVRQYNNLTISARSKLTVDQKVAYIGVQGTCMIAGTFTADGQGQPGSAPTLPLSESSLIDATNAEGQQTGIGLQVPVGGCVSGAGGGGSLGRGGSAGGPGGTYNSDATETPLSKIVGLSGGSLGDNDGMTLTDNFGALIAFPGAGGGAGWNNQDKVPATSIVAGGNGGGVIYIECNTLSFTGTLTANGGDGADFDAVAGGAGGAGGGGGVILVRAQRILVNSGDVSVNGGLGGASGPGFTSAGKGALGFVDIVELP